MNQDFRRVQGPFTVYAIVAPQPVEVLNLPFEQIAGAQLAVKIADNLAGGFGGLASQTVQDDNILAVAQVEVEIVGLLMGVEDVLLRACMRMITGPIVYTFEEEPFQNISIRARMLRGGLPQLVPTNSIESQTNRFNTTRGFTAKLDVTIQPRYLRLKPPVRGCDV